MIQVYPAAGRYPVVTGELSSSFSNASGSRDSRECTTISAGKWVPLRLTPMLFMPALRAP